ncbi:T9SS type B sorting domain-containing protein [Flavobacterium silvaticum]|uniref:T9SS type B sorting domain-containing protein n=1 Tax=Flavobacterium silvaticum TaxID=1852020 RepID=A0A972JHC2_9FLAO|nr:gliding motility-associated C-terminal domain-containing protein [Flavobacterium silvaticum]NMH27780.1 T9SS type B sorting domain-containing protein [Flavobacterium silvaticum]
MTCTLYSRLSFLVCFFVFVLGVQKSGAQCFQIESILVDACGTQEGLNEMVRFRIGSTDQNTSNLGVVWPNNPFQGLIQDASTAAKVATINSDILDAGGCGQLLEPVNGVLPANALVILCTSHLLDTSLNDFGPITENIYIIFQNNSTVTGGHFANSGTGLRTLTISFGAGCIDTVTYDRALLVNTSGATTAADGATVLFSDDNQPTYINNGCSAPVPLFTADAGNAVNGCAGASVSLSGSAQGYDSVLWTAPSGTFSNPDSLTTTYTAAADATGTITLTLTATNICGGTVSDTVTFTVQNGVVPNFPTTLAICQGSTAPTLNTTSPNGITGTWNPSTINNTTSGNYVFTPNPNQCASSVTLAVTVTNSITPDFAPTLTLCQGTTAPALNTTSPNGIVGTWNPSAINNTTSGSYVFTPNPNQCAAPVTLAVTVTNSITPDFAPTLTLCQGTTAPALNTTSPNGIVGTWNPSIINNTTSGNYVFTPNPNQCAAPVTLAVTVTNSITPDFATTLVICQGTTAPTLNTTSPNGIVGTWNPSIINNTTSGNYVFTPNPNQCASAVNLAVTVTNSITPDFAPALVICQGSTAPALNTTSPNGIVGTWNPSIINNTTSGNYVFTPNPNQCAAPVTLAVTVTNSITPDFATTLVICQGTTAPTLNTTSPNGIVGTWNPSTITNTTSGNYVFTPNPNQCAVPVTLEVTVTDGIVPDFETAFTICQDSEVSPLPTTSPNGITGTWNPSTVSNTSSGSYAFTPDPNQCAVPITLQVTVETFEIQTSQGCVGGQYLVQAESPSSQDGYVFVWTDGSGTVVGNDSSLDVSDLSDSFGSPMEFTLTVTSQNGCAQTESVTVNGTACTIPKGVSPNGDMLNDTFNLSGMNVSELKIFNRYGTEVYSRKNYTNEWFGQSNSGTELPDETYYYYMTTTTGSARTGWVYLIRQQ